MNRTRRRLAKRRRALRGVKVTVFSAGGTVGKIRAWAKIAAHVRASVDECEDAPSSRSCDGWEGRLEGFCPVQGYGTLGELSWYFRARWEEWRFEVYACPFPSDTYGWRLPDVDPIFEVEGDADGDASWMPFSEAWRHIESSIVAFRAREVAQ
jgi:hypothetical protein